MCFREYLRDKLSLKGTRNTFEKMKREKNCEMFSYSLEEIRTAEKIFCKLENKLGRLAKEFGMTFVNGEDYIFDSYSFDFYEDEDGNSLTDITVVNMRKEKDALSFPFPTSWLWDEDGSHKNAYFEWKSTRPKIIYRPHNGDYDNSMNKIKWFFTEEEMLNYIVRANEFVTDISSLFVGNEIIYDKKNQWNTKYVLCNNFAGKKLENPICIGMFSVIL